MALSTDRRNFLTLTAATAVAAGTGYRLVPQ
ncbi:twin-arginine translocation signal domain-containing protein [Glycomyces luteolus]|uniref:Twin-arginine translocation signal domain-containing protein n=1 Tax=Glycomyces luteolus TaxID=2670330 RepID=A0A9X3SRW6_9ACTN|nr:twin-arginine translocation signal domain-containing protein [Glycomyces luteolus]MDA1361871.1 twin-arginine translocation signal domain-containing protein [Glycomyces luteolus]